MKLLAIADIEDLHWKHGAGWADLLISCGDVCDQVILEAAAAYGYPQILAVKGNHDSDDPFQKPIVDLHLRTKKFGDYTFGGLRGAWKYKEKGAFLYDHKTVREFLKDFPRVNFFISHNSPRKIHDKEDRVHFGFRALNTYIKTKKPEFVIHGHQHINKTSLVGDTFVIGVCGYQIVQC